MSRRPYLTWTVHGDYGRQPHSIGGDRLRRVRAVRPPAVHPGAGGQAGRHGRHPPARGAGRGRRGSGSTNVDDVDALLRRDDVDLVYIATPPFLHHPQAMAALEAGKHVIVEKPLALTVAQADAMIAAARQRDRLLVANLMQRYNPLFDAVAPAGREPGAGRGAARVVRELRLGREPAGRPLVLGPRQERRHLRRARGPLLRPVRRLARAGAGRGGPGRGPAGDRDRGARPLHGPLRRRRPWSTSTTASTRPAGWTGRSCGWSSSGAT